jgi:hypothetical protein
MYNCSYFVKEKKKKTPDFFLPVFHLLTEALKLLTQPRLGCGHAHLGGVATVISRHNTPRQTTLPSAQQRLRSEESR